MPRQTPIADADGLSPCSSAARSAEPLCQPNPDKDTLITSNDIDDLLRHRAPLLRIAESTHQAAGPKWSRDLKDFFDMLAVDPDTALGRERVPPIMATITSLMIAEGVTIAMGPTRARTTEIRSSLGYDTAVAAARDLVTAVEQRNPDLGRELYELMLDVMSAFLERVRLCDEAGIRPQPAA